METIKVGDKVRIADNVPEIYTQTIFSVHIPMDMEVEKVQDGSAHITPILSGAGGLSFEYIIPIKYLTKVNAEADANEELQEEYARFMSRRTSISLADRIEREHIQRRMRVLSQDDLLKDFNPAEHEVNPKPHYTPKIMSDTEFWVKYEADLAKEIALKITNKKMDNTSLDVANYAVSVAKAVVENLKKK